MSGLYPWLQPTWNDLLARRRATGLPHALLFTGVKGVGKQALSRHLAQWLLCKQAQAQSLDTACGQCHSCRLWAAGSHPDFLECEPEDGSRQIRIDGVRKVNDFFAQTSQLGGCQVVVVRPAEVMNINAANALLKTLEEPAGDSYLLLETERFGSVLPTIRSRCQRVVLQAAAPTAATLWLQQQGQALEAITLALQIHPGAPLAALAWLEQEGGLQQQWLQQLQQWSNQQLSLPALAEDWAKIELIPLLHWWYIVALDCVKSALGVAVEQQSLQGAAQSLVANATLDKAKLLTLQSKLQALLGQLMSGQGNYNKQLLIETLLLQWHRALNSD